MRTAKTLCALSVLQAGVSLGALTLDQDFGAEGKAIGAAGSGWSTLATDLVGKNCGSFFFDASFDEGRQPANVLRTVATLRTASRLTLGWRSDFNKKLQFVFTDNDHTYGMTLPHVLVPGRRYSLGVTWDGEAVRVYLDGVCIHSGVQPLPVRDVSNFCLGPYSDGWHGARVWADDVHVFRLRLWDEARTPEDVAAESKVCLRPLLETRRPLLKVPPMPLKTSLPQLIRGNFAGKSGELPPHAYRLSYDKDNLYLEVDTVFPGRIPYSEGLLRTPELEPEVWGSESWEAYFLIGGHTYRFAANVAGGTTEARDDVSVWNGEWRYTSAREMKIDDSVHWKARSVIPWKTFEQDGVPAGTNRVNLCHSWTLATLGGFSSMNTTGRSYSYRDTWPELTFGSCAAFTLSKRTDPASGEYQQESSVTAAKRARTSYGLYLARMDGRFAPMPLYVRERVLEAGQTANDMIQVRTDVPGYDALVHELVEDGVVVMREIVPYTLSLKPFVVTQLFLKEQIRVSPTKRLSGMFRLIAPDGIVVDERDSSGGDLVFPFPRGNAAGKWKIVLTDGDRVLGEKVLTYPGVGEWERQNFHEDWILPPFTPLRSERIDGGLKASLYGRTYGWRDSFLPRQIVSQGEKLLLKPTEIVVGGRPVDATEFAITSNRPHHVGFAAQGNGVASRGWLEYDGVQWNEVTVGPVSAASLSVRCTLRGSLAKYLHASGRGGWGQKRTEKVTGGRQRFGNVPTMWIGDEEKGLCLFFESRDGWNADAAETFVVERSGEGVVLTMNVAKDLPAGKPFTFAFGLLATPMRPRSANYPFDTLGSSQFSQLNRSSGRPVTDVAYLVCPGCGDLGSFFGDQGTDDGRKTARALRRDLDACCRDFNVRPVFYTCAHYLSERYPETEAFLPEWTFRPATALDYEHTGHFVYDCCPTTSASDFFVWRFKKLLKRYPEMRGIYFDFGVVTQCSNPEHGCRERTPLLAQREYYRRMVVAQVEAGIRDPLVVIHNTDCVQPPAMTFVTHFLNGEHIRQASSSLLHDKKDILDTYGIEMFASELSTLPWGVSNAAYFPHDRLSEKNGGDEPVEEYQFRVTRASMAGCLVHNTMQCLWRNHYGVFDKVIRLYDRFGVDRARFIGYWRHPAKVTAGKDVYVSCYARDGKVLAVVSHLGHEHLDQDVEIDFDIAKLGLKEGVSKATDLMTAPDPEYDELFEIRKRHGVDPMRVSLELGDFGTKILGFVGTRVRLRLPYHTFALVEVE